jgi:6-phospho-3-hexuloisomerase
MEYIKKTAEGIAKHALEVIALIDEEQVEQMMKTIESSYSTFIAGSGRSGLVGKAFAMRLMHLGFRVHVVGDVTTPAITRKDVLIALSGSGETKNVTLAANAAKEVGAKVVGITTNPRSSLGKSMDVGIYIQSKTNVAWKHYTSHVLKGNYDDLTPMGTLFEDSAHLFLDGLIAEFMVRLGKNETDMQKMHIKDK